MSLLSIDYIDLPSPKRLDTLTSITEIPIDINIGCLNNYDLRFLRLADHQFTEFCVERDKKSYFISWEYPLLQKVFVP